jgi:hypothetical protein
VRRVVTGDIVKGKTEEGVLLGGRRMAWVGGLDIRSRPYIGRAWTGGWDTAGRVCGVRHQPDTVVAANRRVTRQSRVDAKWLARAAM